MCKHLLFIFSLSILLIPTANADDKNTISCNEITVSCGTTPTPFFSKDGTLWVAFEQAGHVYVSTSKDLGKSFQTTVKVNQIAEEIYTNGENRPKIKLDSKQRIFVSWTQKTPGRFSGDIRFSRSIDQGKSFSTPITINTDTQLIGHRFDALAINSADEIFLAWFDKRDQAAAKQANKEYRGTALYYAVSTDHGASFSDNMKIADHTCECCRIAVDFNQQDDLYILWRHIFNKNTRDHALIKINNEQSTSPLIRATQDDWHVDACPHHGPTLSIDDHEKLHFAWYTEGANQQGIFYGRIDKLGSDKKIKHAMDSNTTASHPYVLHHQEVVYYIWKRFNGKQTELVLKTSVNDGLTWSSDQIVADTANTSDHPLLISYDENVYISWLAKKEGYQLIEITHTKI